MDMIWRSRDVASTTGLSADHVRDAYPWPEGRRWVRAMMVTTLDGAAAGPDGLSGSISSEVDKAVFNAVRRLAGAVLVGAGTVRAEGYSPMRARPEDAAVRAAAGLAPAPVLAIVSGSLDLDFTGELFRHSTMRPLVITGAGPDPTRAAAAAEHSDLVATTEDRPTAASIVRILEERGLRHVVCEGGPTLLESLVAADLLDEADITVSPTFASTATSPRTTGLETVAGFHLAHVLQADSFLMCRYLSDRLDHDEDRA